MSTTSSKEAYFNPENQVKRLSHKQRCYNALIGETKGLSYFLVAAKAGLTQQQTWKRLSDLNKEDKIIIIGTETINNRTFSLYAINQQPPLFYTKKLSLKDWLKLNFPEILTKYEILIKKEL